jgi:hypothetical protein
MFYAMNTHINKTTIGFGKQKRFPCAGAFTPQIPCKTLFIRMDRTQDQGEHSLLREHLVKIPKNNDKKLHKT